MNRILHHFKPSWPPVGPVVIANSLLSLLQTSTVSMSMPVWSSANRDAKTVERTRDGEESDRGESASQRDGGGSGKDQRARSVCILFRCVYHAYIYIYIHICIYIYIYYIYIWETERAPCIFISSQGRVGEQIKKELRKQRKNPETQRKTCTEQTMSQ